MKRKLKEVTETWLKATNEGIKEVTELEVTSKAIFSVARFFELYLLNRVDSLSPIYTCINTLDDMEVYDDYIDTYPELKKALKESKLTENSEFIKFTKQDINSFENLVNQTKGIELSSLLFQSDMRSKIMRVKSVFVSAMTVIFYTNNGNILLDISKITEWYESDEFIIVSYDADNFIKIWIQ